MVNKHETQTYMSTHTSLLHRDAELSLLHRSLSSKGDPRMNEDEFGDTKTNLTLAVSQVVLQSLSISSSQSFSS